MAIETEIKDEVQKELVVESREERLERLFALESEILAQKVQRQKLVDQANSLKNGIKALESDKVDLVHLLDAGQVTIAAVESTGQPDDLGLDDEDAIDDEQEAA